MESGEKKGSEWDKHPERSPKMEVSPTVTGGNIPPSGKKSNPKKEDAMKNYEYRGFTGNRGADYAISFCISSTVMALLIALALMA